MLTVTTGAQARYKVRGARSTGCRRVRGAQVRRKVRGAQVSRKVREAQVHGKVREHSRCAVRAGEPQVRHKIRGAQLRRKVRRVGCAVGSVEFH